MNSVNSQRIVAPRGDEPETLPGAKDALELLDTAVERTGGQRRDGQRTMAAHVAQALDTRRHLLVQAGTGTGKSLAYLVPAIKRSIDSESPIVIATATLALQSQIVNRDVPRLLETLDDQLERPVDVALLKGRNNYVCLHKLEGGYPDEEDPSALFSLNSEGAQASGHPDRAGSSLAEEVVRLRSWAESSDTGDRDELLPGVSDKAWRQVSVTASECLGRKCPLVEECFSELARHRAGEADVVITNHALLAINAFEGIGVLPEHDTVIVDEAHELVDRVTGAVTGAISPVMVRAAARAMRKNTSAEHEPLQAAAEALDAACTGKPAELLPQGLTSDLKRAMELTRDAARAALSDTKPEAKDSDAGRQMARARLTEVLELSERTLGADGTFEVVWLSRVGGWEPGRGYVAAADTDPATIHVAPLSVASRLREGLFHDRTVVLTSATLSIGHSFDSVAGSLGLKGEKAPTWEGLDVGSPFEYPKQGMLYMAADLPKPGRGVSEEQLERILQLVEASGGGALGLFSSKRGAEQAAEYVRQNSDLNILVQGESSLRGLVKEFTDDEDACLFGTMSLWQGVDVPGRSCRLVMIDRIPFPRPDDPLSSARTRAVSQSGGNGFMAVSAYHAAIRLAQGSGRLIRASDDRGVVAVLDSRLATARYGGFLRSALPPLWTTDKLPTVTGALRRLAESSRE